MNDYLQPDFYRFNRDSLELVKWVMARVTKANAILDLGAGCGVMGMELAQYYLPKELTLLELQEDFRPYLEKNAEIFVPKDTKTNIVLTSFSQWIPKKAYDLIVCNPPYYLPHCGRPSPDDRRAKARSFTVDDWDKLLGLIMKSKIEKGRAFLVLKSDSKIEGTFMTAARKLTINFHSEKSADLIFIEL